MAERGREGKSDIDRFLAEIDRLRKKAQAGPAQVPAVKVKPVVAKPIEQKPKPRLEMPPPATIPTVGVVRIPDEVPVARPVTVATPVTPPGTVRVEAPEPTVKAVRTVQAAGQKTQRTQTQFAKQLSGLLRGPQSVSMGIVLGEIFGPPKSQRG